MIYRFSAVAIKIPIVYFAEMHTLILKFIESEAKQPKQPLKKILKLRDAHFPTSKLTTKLVPLRQCGIGLKVKTQITGVKLINQK